MTASSSGCPLLLFLWPTGLAPKTAWVVSGLSMLATKEKKKNPSMFLSFPRCLRVLTDEGLQDGLRAFDELVVNLVDQVSQNLLILRQLEIGETLLILRGGVVFADGLQRTASS